MTKKERKFIMKKFKKVMAMGLATMAAVSAMSMSALAAENDTTINAIEVTQDELDGISRIVNPWDNMISPASLITEESVFLPRNIDGYNGEACGEFVADAKNAVFTLTQANGGTETYNVQLYKGTIANGGSRVAKYDSINVGSGWARGNLVIGATYYYKVSSNDCPINGTNANFKIETY